MLKTNPRANGQPHAVQYTANETNMERKVPDLVRPNSNSLPLVSDEQQHHLELPDQHPEHAQSAQSLACGRTAFEDLPVGTGWPGRSSCRPSCSICDWTDRELVGCRRQQIEHRPPAAQRPADIPALLGGGCLFRPSRQLRGVNQPVAPGTCQ